MGTTVWTRAMGPGIDSAPAIGLQCQEGLDCTTEGRPCNAWTGLGASRKNRRVRCSIVPPYLLARIAAGAEEQSRPVVAQAARRALAETDAVHFRRQTVLPFRGEDFGGAPRSPRRVISDAESTETLPGIPIRREG